MENSHKPRNGDTPNGVQEISVVCESSDQSCPISGRLFMDASQEFDKMNFSPQVGKSVKSPAAQLIMNIHHGKDFSENEFEKKEIMVTDNAELPSDSSSSRPPV